MPGLTAGDSGVRVVVTPSQSSYFAGEPFSVTITFTNTRTPDSRPSRALSNGHKRGAHSISSAPLARPPTSPGTPRTPLPPLAQRSKSGDDTPTRKGLIGRPQPRGLKGAEELPELIEQRRKRLLAKSLSVSISPHELEEQVAEGTLVRSASFVQQIFKDVRCMSCRVVSIGLRSTVLTSQPLPPLTYRLPSHDRTPCLWLLIIPTHGNILSLTVSLSKIPPPRQLLQSRPSLIRQAHPLQRSP